MACSCKLVVEVVRANGLTDGVDGPNLCVELRFDRQSFKTSVTERVSNPEWNERAHFSVSNKDKLPVLSLEAYVHNVAEFTYSESLLGKVRIPGTSFADSYNEVLTCHPLSLDLISIVKGRKVELLLKVFIQKENEQLADESHETLELLSVFNHVTAPFFSDNGMASLPAYASYSHNHFTALSQDTQESLLIEINPSLGCGRIVEHMPYIFVCVVKARGLPDVDATGSLNPYVEVKYVAYKGITKYMKKEQNPEWNTTFAFSKLHTQKYEIHVVVMSKDRVRDDFVGKLSFDQRDIQERLPARPPVQPQWHQLLDVNEKKTEGELMLAIWEGSQADEAYPVARYSDSLNLDASVLPHIRPQVYDSPILWYVRVDVMKFEGIAMEHETQTKRVYVTASVGDQRLRLDTKTAVKREADYFWGEELLFVAAEPLESELKIEVKERLGPHQEKIIGQIAIPLASLDKRFDGVPIQTTPFQLERPPEAHGDKNELNMPLGTIYLMNCLDGGYTVLDDSQIPVDDTRATDNQTSQNPLIGSLELGILKANILHTRDANPYCVAKYGGKWVRTRTVINSVDPVFNEQYTWDVFDTATILTVGVFDNGQLVEERSNNNRTDNIIGKVRIRLSCLQQGRICARIYPLLVLFPSGLKKTGELHLSVRFSLKTSTLNLLHMYSRPILPEMHHYTHPITIEQREMMRNFAMQIMAARMSQMEPPLRKEVVLHMYDESSSHFSLRKSKANFLRLMQVISPSPVIRLCRWFELVCSWRNPVTSFLVLVIFILAVIFHELILPLIPLFIIFIVMANYRWRPRYPPHLDARISHAEAVHPDEFDEEFDAFPTSRPHPDEFDEEFDAFPTSRPPDIVRMRYDRLKSVAGRIQTVVGDLCSCGERIQALASWRDPRATFIFELFTLAAAAVLYYVPYRYLVGIAGVYTIMAPLFRRRSRTPSFVANFFRRLPSKADMLI